MAHRYTDLNEANRRIRNLESSLKEFVLIAGVFLRRLDTTMQEPESATRGRAIAHLSNELEYARDKARYFVLGIDYRNDPELKDGKRLMPKDFRKPKK